MYSIASPESLTHRTQLVLYSNLANYKFRVLMHIYACDCYCQLIMQYSLVYWKVMFTSN